MKTIRLSLLCVLLVTMGITKASANSIVVQDVQLEPGGTINLDIALENETTNLMGWQCDISLPTGLSLTMKENGNPKVSLGSRFGTTEHSISSSVLPNGDYRFIATSMYGEAIPATSGTLFTVTLTVDATVSLGKQLTGNVKNIEFNTLDNQKLVFDNVSFTATIESSTPPADGTDMTGYIKNPGFDEDEDIDSGQAEGWTIDRPNAPGNLVRGPLGAYYMQLTEDALGYMNYCFESWHCYEWDVWQELSNLPVGLYELQMQGYVRCEEPGYARGEDLLPDYPSPIYVYMNDAVSQLPSVYSEEKPTDKEYTMVEDWTLEEVNDKLYPNSMGGASQCFGWGMYKSKAMGLIAQKGDKFRIGVRMNKNENWWCIWDNFKLTYRVPEATMVKELLEKALNELDQLPTLYGSEHKDKAAQMKAAAQEAMNGTDGLAMLTPLADLYAIMEELRASNDLFTKLIQQCEMMDDYASYAPASEETLRQAVQLSWEISETIGQGNTTNATDDQARQFLQQVEILLEALQAAAYTNYYSIPAEGGWLWITVNNPGYNNSALDFVQSNSRVERILNQKQELVYDEGYDAYVGTLKTLEATTSYKVKVKQESYSSYLYKMGVRTPVNATIHLKKGWNWLPYLPSSGCYLWVLDGINPEQNDKIVGRDDFAVYNGQEWEGGLEVMYPLNGFMYFSAKDVDFSYPYYLSRQQRASAQRTPAQKPSSPWIYSVYKYPDNMSVIAEVINTGGKLSVTEDFSYSIGAFCGDECRGIGKWASDKLFLTVHGQAGDLITFRAYNPLTGETFDIAETMAFISDCLGTLDTPQILTLNTVAMSISSAIAAGNAFDIYTVGGQLVRQQVTSLKGLPTGIYIAKGKKIVIL